MCFSLRDPESAVQTEIRSDAHDSLNQSESEQLNDYLSRRWSVWINSGLNVTLIFYTIKWVSVLKDSIWNNSVSRKQIFVCKCWIHHFIFISYCTCIYCCLYTDWSVKHFQLLQNNESIMTKSAYLSLIDYIHQQNFLATNQKFRNFLIWD